MARKKQPPILEKLKDSVKFDLAPEGLTDSALKLAAVGSTIFIVKGTLDAIDGLNVTGWMEKHPTFVNDFIMQGWFLLGPSGVALEAIYAELPKPWEVGQHVGETLKRTGNWAEAFRVLLQDLGFKVQQAKSALEFAQINIDEAQLLLTEAETRLTLAKANPYTPQFELDDLTQRVTEARAALDLAVKAKTELVAKADLERAIEERARWMVAIVVGLFLATTMIYAGDSILDLISGTLNSLGIIPKAT